MDMFIFHSNLFCYFAAFLVVVQLLFFHVSLLWIIQVIQLYVQEPGCWIPAVGGSVL